MAAVRLYMQGLQVRSFGGTGGNVHGGQRVMAPMLRSGLWRDVYHFFVVILRRT